MNPNGTRDKSFTVPISPLSSIAIKIHVAGVQAQGLPLIPWASSHTLAGILHKLDITLPPPDHRNIPILEIGAGIGLVGLIASMVWHQPAVVTDLQPIVPGLMMNIRLNEKALEEHKGEVKAGALDWDHPDTLTLHDGTSMSASASKAKIIIAADTIYAEEHPRMVAQTVARWLAPGKDARYIMMYPLRVAYLDQIRELWELLEGHGLEAVEEGKVEAEEMGGEWDDERLCEWSIWRWKSGHSEEEQGK